MIQIEPLNKQTSKKKSNQWTDKEDKTQAGLSGEKLVTAKVSHRLSKNEMVGSSEL